MNIDILLCEFNDLPGMDLVKELERDGVAHIPGALNSSELSNLREHAAERYGACLRALLLKQALRMQAEDGVAAPAKFAEVVERDGGRLDVRHDVIIGDPVAAALSTTPLLPFCQSVLGEDVELVAAGNVVAMSIEGWLESSLGDDEDVVLADNLGAQAWHADGPHLFGPHTASLPPHALTIFFPLIDLTANNGPTEFAFGTHVLGREYVPPDDGDGPCTSSSAKLPASSDVTQRRTILAAAGDGECA